MEDLIDKTDALVDASDILKADTIAPGDWKDMYQSLKNILKLNTEIRKTKILGGYWNNWLISN